tara:strand:- start:437 stop:820 length:384 start_codon:yes stop_codon:yes gene_type:complete
MIIKDDSLKNTKYKSDNKDYNLKNTLLKQQKIDFNFLEKIKFLQLEEIIALKLIVSAEGLNGKFLNFPFLKFTTDICREAIIKFALSISNNNREASLILGMKKVEILNYIKKHNLRDEYQNYSEKST